ncbi:MAG: hypothetical protein M3440_14325 [Chloroflexota bacterium]|nr:hypothetical protein [Chloroflexota bacterium]
MSSDSGQIRTTRPATVDNDQTGEYTPAGEAQGQDAQFTADQVATAFEVDVDRVHNAFQGEFQLGADASVDSRQAQQLAEVIIGDEPQDRQQAALMKLGAFTPRTDEDYGRGQGDPDDESDKLEDQHAQSGIS